MRYLIIAFVVAGIGGALAQDAAKPAPPVHAKRTPRSSQPLPPDAQDALQEYRFADSVQAMQATDAPGATSAQSAAPLGTGVPKGFKPKTDVPLDPTAKQAVQMSEAWRGERNEPAPGPDGRVLFSYGAGLPTAVCAPLRICIIELQPGEKLIGEPHIGDSVRWNVAPSMYGKGDTATSLIVIKPQASGLDTDLLVTTDRRAYYLRLVSKPDAYVARVAFAYPEDEAAERKWQEQVAKQREQAKAATRIVDMAPGAIDSLFFDYRISGGDVNMRPVRVLDDGVKTYIQMNPAVKHREAPVLVVVDGDGKPDMVNYRVKGDVYVVDRLFDHAQLIIGAGKKAKKVEIVRAEAGSKG
jgi:type IV secretion system protein VirB9